MVLPSFWEENLAVLKRINQALAAQLQEPSSAGASYGVEWTPPSRYLCRVLQSDTPTSPIETRALTADDTNGLGEWIHPPANHPEQIPELFDRDLARHDLFIVVRMGLGNAVFDLYERLVTAEILREENRRIIAVEDRGDLLRAALTLYDWRPLFESTRFLLLFGSDTLDLLGRFFDRYTFAALDRPFVLPGSGPAESTFALADQVSKVVERIADAHRQLAVGLLQGERNRRLSQKKSHVRKVLWLVPGHNYLQKCCVKALQELGIEATQHVWVSSTYRYIKRFEWIRLLQECHPDALVLVNATPMTFFGGDEIADLPIPVASWFVDNPRRFVREPTDLAGVDLCASFDRYYLGYLEELGATKVMEIRTAAGLFRQIDSVNPPDGPAVSFVGELGTRGFWDLETLLSRSVPVLQRAIQTTIEESMADPTQPVEELYAQRIDTAQFPLQGCVIELVENHTAYQLRKKTLESIADLGLVTFGDTEWGDPRRAGSLAERWAGKRLDYFKELPGVYAGSQINVNIFHPQCKLAPNPRVYDVLACGGFLLTTDSPGLADEFVDGEHLVTFRNGEELRDQVRYYRDHPEERRQIAAAGQERILAGCRYHDRMRRLFGAFDPILTGESYVYSC